MILDRRIKFQLALFAVISVVAGAIMVFQYVNAPALLFGVGHYSVTLELPRSAGLYPNANVTYRGTEVGQVTGVSLTETGVKAKLLLKSGIAIPSQLRAEVHSQWAVGEQYVDLMPRSATGPALKNGDVIPASETALPPDIDMLLDAANRGLAAIPQDNLKTVIDESYTAVGGLGPELSRLVNGSTQLAIDAEANLDPLTALIDRSKPVLDSQTDTADAIQSWAAHLADITSQLRSADTAFAGVLRGGGPALEQARQLISRLQPTLPLLLANLVSVGQVAVTYQPALEQLLVLFPQGVANMQGTLIANHDTKQDYNGLYLDFKLNFNLPPPCLTGFLPPQQQRVPTFVDYPNRPAGDLYCRVPQDSPFNVRGARNYPCLTVPGKRAPTIKMCESDEHYAPLNDGYNWKGDPNATLSGQDIPQLPPPGSPSAANAPPPPAPAPIAAAEYDPATGTYIGPDGRLYSQQDLSQTKPKEQTWQSMLMPPTGN
ncbi:MCE family protein [Mycobacterium lentiflavum]|uniref:MCE family protein n=1 Tax=Mycobacterium lentiflavum TaxID=141349 RepID=A0ABY3UV72_MYCLN|nr:MlaD family protein [Mycobacterium lentiflavum]ULP41594.1 MCE family protein [Mycobacterium lentiflavum]